MSTSKGNPWNGNSAEDFNMKTQKERTFRVNLPTCFTAKDVIAAVSRNLGHGNIDTVGKQSQQGYWTIITKTTEDAKILLDLEELYMSDDEAYCLTLRLKRAALLTLPFVDPEIRNSEIRDYFKMYGDVKTVAYEYYREAQIATVKTGRRLVFIDFYEGCGAPPFCIVRGQKISVSYRGHRHICYHCNVEGHTKAHCPIKWFKTCYNCGSPTHEQNICWEPTFVAYFFEEGKKYPPHCYPTNHQSEDPDDDTIYGLIQNVEEARLYNLEFDPYFYTQDAAKRYRDSTYEDKDPNPEQETEHEENDENIKGIWESDSDENEEKETEDMDTDKPDKTPKDMPTATNQTSNTDNTATKKKMKQKKKKTPNQPQNLPKEKTPKPQTSGPPTQEKPAENKETPVTTTKRKLETNSPKVDMKKTKDTKSNTEDTSRTETTITINGKACVQRNLDFSGSQQQSKIPIIKQVRAGRTPGKQGTNSETRPRQRSRSRHREVGSVASRGQDSC